MTEGRGVWFLQLRSMYQASLPYWYFQMVWPMEQTNEMAKRQPKSTRIWKLVMRSTLESFRGGRVEFWRTQIIMVSQIKAGFGIWLKWTEVDHTHLHEFGVMSCVDYDTVHPLCVPELSSSQQDLIRTQWHSAKYGANTTIWLCHHFTTSNNESHLRN